MGTRAKTKKVKDAGEARQDVLRKVAASKELSFAEKGRLYHWDRPVCQGDRVNAKDNPNCLCALIPPPNGVRKQGLWAKIPEAVAALGEDPTFRKRESHEHPIGLTNLGATCYVNAILQCLYMNVDFRKGLFHTEERLLEGNPVLRQLCRLFVKLQMSDEDPVDPAVFAKTLNLDNGVQQDGQEFMKLLLTLLEKLLGQSARPDVRNLVQGLFRGNFSYVTRCSTCGNESDSSKNLVDFYELEVNVKGFDDLQASLDDYLGEELLEGENQYLCEHCNARVDATRSVKLRTLPPLLNFQLKRFVFNNKTATKKKVTSRFSFPVSIDLTPRISSDPPSSPPPKHEPAPAKSVGAVYDLAAILVHKGTMATSGHYIAHVRDERTGDWWQFDDETVTSLGDHPLGEATAKAAKENGQKGDNEGREKSDETKAEESAGPSSRAEGVAPANGVDPNLLTSADSYMLMYRRRDERQVAAMRRQEERRRRAAETAAKNAEDEIIIIEGGGKEGKRKSEGERREKVPKRARTGKAVKEAPSSASGSSVAEKNGEKQVTVDSPLRERRVSARTNGVAKVGNGNTHGDKQNGAQDLDELEDDVSIEAPEALVREVENDNEAFAAAIDAYKSERERIEAEVNRRRQEVREILTNAAADPAESDFRWINTEWLRAWADNKDPPDLIDNSPLTCVHDGIPPRSVPLMKRINKETWRELDKRYGGGPELSGDECCVECIRDDADAARTADSFRTKRTIMRERLEQELALGAPGTHYVSKQWLAQWQRRRLVDTPSEADKGPTAALLCKHEMLKPEFAPGAKRQLVPGDFWAYVQEIAEEVAGPDDRGHWEVLASMQECATCRQELGEEMSYREGVKSTKLAEKAASEALFAGRPLPLAHGDTVYLMPTKWLDSWRDYLGATGKTLDLVGEPPPLEDALVAVFCKHGDLAVLPPELVRRKNDFVQESKECALTVVSAADWLQLQQRWRSSTGISAFVIDPRPPETAISKVLAKDVSNQADPPRLITIPDVCDTCHKERLDQELAERLSYRQQEIIVELFPGPEPPAHVTGFSNEGERRSRRVRKYSTVGGGRMTVKVNADMTVNELKMTIWERMEVDAQNQRLGFLKTELDDDDKILAEYGIVANSRLWLIDTGEHASRDIVEFFEPLEEAGEMENGFKGTGLWGGAASDHSNGDGAQQGADTDMRDVEGSGSSDREASSDVHLNLVPENIGDAIEGPEKPGKWSCERCTLENSPGRKMCSVCEAARS